jgi:hypothetical protein
VATTTGREFSDTFIVGERGEHLVARLVIITEIADESAWQFFMAKHSIFGASDDRPFVQAVKRARPNRGEADKESPSANEHSP